MTAHDCNGDDPNTDRFSVPSEDQIRHGLNLDDSYEVQRTLSEGPFGVTELVMLEGDGPFVRKRIPSAFFDSQVWSRLSRCQSRRLPRVLAIYEAPDAPTVVCSYVPGNTLEQVIASKGPLSWEEALYILEGVGEALAQLHSNGIIHGDLTPRNIIVAADGAHLIDFGAARLKDHIPPDPVRKAGTWGFSAPEQYGFADADERADTYGLSCITGYMLTGLCPDEDEYGAALRNEQMIPAAIREFVEKGTSFDREKRYQNVGELLGAAKNLLPETNADPGFAGSTCPPAEKKARRSRSGVKKILIAVAALVVLAAIGFFAFSAFAPDAGNVPASSTPKTPASTDNQDTGASSAPEETAGTDSSLAEQVSSSLALDSTGWTLPFEDTVYLWFTLRNESSDLLVEFPEIQVTGRDREGNIVFTDRQVLGKCYAGQSISWASIADCSAPPDTVDFKVLPPTGDNVTASDASPVQFKITGVREVKTDLGSNFAGEVAYASGPAEGWTEGVAVTVQLLDDKGEAVFAETTFADCPADGSPSVFETLGAPYPEYSSVRAFAIPW